MIPRPRVLVLALLALGLAGCDSIFEVDNPNQLVQNDLEGPQAAGALVNGAQASLARALAQLLLPLSIASDELVSIGSLDYGLQLDQGTLSNPSNGVTNSAFPFVAEARFMADEAIRSLEGFDSAGVLPSRSDLARAYLYGGIVYAVIADGYDDFVISDRRDAAPPVGEAEMVELYDRAIQYLDRGLAAARAAQDADLELAVLAQRARAQHARAVWRLLNPAGTAPAAPLVADQGAVDDAHAALALIPSPDWRLQFLYSPNTVDSSLGEQVNVRQEYRVGDAYVVPAADNQQIAGIRLLDPLTGEPDATLRAAVDRFIAGGEYPTVTVVSARELLLILAEAALAGNDRDSATRLLDRLRALDQRPPYAGQVPLTELLQHERRVNLFLQGRRLADHYRFAQPDPAWQATAEAARNPGTLLPIAEIERLSNCYLAGGCGEG